MYIRWIGEFADQLKKAGLRLSSEDDEEGTLYARVSRGEKEILLYLHFGEKPRTISFAAQGKELLNWENYTSKKTRKQTEVLFRSFYEKAKKLMEKAYRPRLYAWGKESYKDHTRWKIVLFEAPDNKHEWLVDQSIVIGVYHRVWKLTTPKAAVKIACEILTPEEE